MKILKTILAGGLLGTLALGTMTAQAQDVEEVESSWMNPDRSHFEYDMMGGRLSGKGFAYSRFAGLGMRQSRMMQHREFSHAEKEEMRNQYGIDIPTGKRMNQVYRPNCPMH